jgi:hypothetical protein
MIVYEYVCVKCGALVRSDEKHVCTPQSSRPSRKPTIKPVAPTATKKNQASIPGGRMKPHSPTDNWPSAEDAIWHIMEARGCSREVALQELQKAIDDGRIAAHIVVAEDVSTVSTVSTPVVSTPVSTVSTPSRLTTWRAKNREAYNAYMRAWRARQKQEKP